MLPVRSLAVAALSMAMAACSSGEPHLPSPQKSSGDQNETPGATVPNLAPSDLAAPLGSGPGDPRVPTWPREFRVTSAERVGIRDESVLAFSLETTQLAPEAATKVLVETISRVASGTPRSAIAAEIGGECVGQVHADDLAATLKAERRGPTTVVQLLLARSRSMGRR